MGSKKPKRKGQVNFDFSNLTAFTKSSNVWLKKKRNIIVILVSIDLEVTEFVAKFQMQIYDKRLVGKMKTKVR